MPFEPERATAYVQDIRKYMQWQSDADMLDSTSLPYLTSNLTFEEC